MANEKKEDNGMVNQESQMMYIEKDLNEYLKKKKLYMKWLWKVTKKKRKC